MSPEFPQRLLDRDVRGIPRTLVVGVIILLFVSLGACGDFVIELPGGYQFVSESPDTQDITRAEGIRAGEPYVPCNVVGYDYDASHIIAKQVARMECFANGINMFDQRDGETYFWVIDAKNRVVHGPFSESQFDAQRKQLGVSDKLSLERRS